MELRMTPKQRAKMLRRHERARNPAPGRTRIQSTRIRRTLEKINNEIDYWLSVTEYRIMRGWLPYENIITPRDEDYLQDFYAMFGGVQDLDDDGYMIAQHDSGQRATNHILAVTWYENDQGGEFLIGRNVFSPLPCSEWGCLPLTLAQWRIIALSMVASRQHWQWLPAVQHYFDDSSFRVGGFMGWTLQRCAKIDNVEAAPGYFFKSESRQASEDSGDFNGWTGITICRKIIDEYLQQENGE